MADSQVKVQMLKIVHQVNCSHEAVTSELALLCLQALQNIMGSWKKDLQHHGQVHVEAVQQASIQAIPSQQLMAEVSLSKSSFEVCRHPAQSAIMSL